MFYRLRPTAILAVLLALVAGSVRAQGIYTCTDSKGKRITADRPILDCIDREQVEHGPTGVPRRKIAPSPTAAELAAQEKVAARQAEERGRAAEEKRRERALLTRYPEQGSHDKERQAALATVDLMKASAQKRTADLLAQRKALQGELEFYKANPAKAPVKLKLQVDDVEAQLTSQQRFIADQEGEKARVNARFDEELSRLKLLWVQAGVSPRASASAAR